jgi:hypothetical protein
MHLRAMTTLTGDKRSKAGASRRCIECSATGTSLLEL